MDVLKVYGDSETDSEDEQCEKVRAVSIPKTMDYLGLADSSDEEYACKSVNVKLTDGLPQQVASGLADIDLLVTSYQFSDRTYGPANVDSASTANISRLKKPQKRKLNDFPSKYKPLRHGLNPETEKCDASLSPVQKLTNSIKLETHPNIQGYIDETNARPNRLPKYRFKTMPGHSGCVNKVAWCTSQHSHLLLSASMDKLVKVWDVFSGKCIFSWSKHQASVCSADWVLSGERFVSGGYDKYARLVDVEQGKEVSFYVHPDVVSCVRHHPVDDHLFVTGSPGKLSLWDTRLTQPVKNLESKFGQVLDVVFIHGGREVVCSNDIVMRDSADRTIMAWDVSTGAILSNQIYQERYTCPALAVHPTDDYFVAQSNGNYIAQFSTTRPYKMNRKKRYEGHKVQGYRAGVDFSSDGQYLYSGDANGNLYCFNSQTSSLVKCLTTGLKHASLSVACHPLLDSLIAVSFWDGAIQLWQ